MSLMDSIRNRVRDWMRPRDWTPAEYAAEIVDMRRFVALLTETVIEARSKR